MWQKCIITFFAFVVNSVISISIHFCPVLFIYLLRFKALYDPSKLSRGNSLGWMGSICPVPNFNPSVQPPPWTSPLQKKPRDFKWAPWQILCTVPRIPSDGPGCRQEWLLSVWGVLLLAVIMKIAVVIYSRHLSGWRGLRLVLKGKKQTPSIYLNASMLARIILDPASSTEEVITCFF